MVTSEEEARFEAIIDYLELQFEEIMAELLDANASRREIHGVDVGAQTLAVNIAPRIADTLVWIISRYGRVGVELGAQFLAYAATPRTDDSQKPVELVFEDVESGQPVDPSNVDADVALVGRYVAAMAARDEDAVNALWATIAAAPSRVVVHLYAMLFSMVLHADRMLRFEVGN